MQNAGGGSPRIARRLPRRPPLRPPGLALARSYRSSKQLPQAVRGHQCRTKEGCCPEPRKPPKLVLDAEGRHYATTQGHDARRHKPPEIVLRACSNAALHQVACFFNAASTASSAAPRPWPTICFASIAHSFPRGSEPMPHLKLPPGFRTRNEPTIRPRWWKAHPANGPSGARALRGDCQLRRIHLLGTSVNKGR